MKLLITGGAGFIGSNFSRRLFEKHPDYKVVCLDKLNYAGNIENIKGLNGKPNYKFVKGDICDEELVDELLKRADAVINFAAQTHVDRSIINPAEFVRTNILGVYLLLEAARKNKISRFIQISTDEVYGSIHRGKAREESRFKPSNPYSASKAAGDLIAQSYFHTYKLPVIIARPSNNFGPYQHPEKVVPLSITNAIDEKPLPLYGDGQNKRDWLYVKDCCEALDVILHKGKPGEAYNVGAGQALDNLTLMQKILKKLGKPQALIKYVKDRPGHDRRYSMDWAKMKNLGWQPRCSFDKAISETIDWYKNNRSWWEKITLQGGEFTEYYKQQYGAES